MFTCKGKKMKPMGIDSVFVILCATFVIVCGNTVSNVRLVDHETYMVSLIQETMREVEEMEWCNLRVNDIILDLEEDVLGTTVVGQVEYTNGFVVSIQWMDIIRSRVQQLWRFDRVSNTTTVTVQGTLSLHAVTLGFDVLANLVDGPERYTATFVHPLLEFNFAVIKDLFLDDIKVTVTGTVPRNTNAPRFLPETHHSQAFAALYDWNSTTVGIIGWGSDVFQPIVHRLALSEIQFPRICYNCPV